MSILKVIFGNFFKRIKSLRGGKMLISKLQQVLEQKKIKKTPFAKSTGIPRTFIENLITNDVKSLDLNSTNILISELSLKDLSELMVYIPYDLGIGDIETLDDEGEENTSYIRISIMFNSLDKFKPQNHSFDIDFLIADNGNVLLENVSDVEHWRALFESYDEIFFSYTIDSIIKKLTSYLFPKDNGTINLTILGEYNVTGK